MSEPIKTKELFAECLKEEGFIRYDGYPVAYVKNDLSVLLLLPFSELRNRPYYSAAFNGFIEIDHSVSLLSDRFMLALIAEWGCRYFGAPENPDRARYLEAALKRLFGLYTGQANLAQALMSPEDEQYPLAHQLTKGETDRIIGRNQSAYPTYIIRSLWSGRVLQQSLQSGVMREAKLPICIDSKEVRISTAQDLLVALCPGQSQRNFMGNCVLKTNAQGDVEHSWLLPKQGWRWFMFEPGQTYFLSKKNMVHYLPRILDEEDDAHQSIDDVLTHMAVSEDDAATASQLEGLLKIVAELDGSKSGPVFCTPILEQLLLQKRPLSVVLNEIDAQNKGARTNLKVNPASLLLACASRAPEFQGQGRIAGNQYCPMPEIDYLAKINLEKDS